MSAFLAHTDIIDWMNPCIQTLARKLHGNDGPIAIAERCFRWVRDEVHHSIDHGDNVVTLTASEVLRHRTGFCYAKSHLLAALLRANGIPAGFCYQRLSLDDTGPPFCLHGFNAIELPEVGWYRVDARGNKPGIQASFDPPHETLAFQPRLPGEQTFADILPEPVPVVVEVLRRHCTVKELLPHLPDVMISRHHVSP